MSPSSGADLEYLFDLLQKFILQCEGYVVWQNLELIPARIQSSAGEISRIAGTIGNYPESVRRIARSLRLGSSGSYGISSQLQGAGRYDQPAG